MVQELRHHAIFGVWYVVDNSRRQEPLDTTLIEWLAAFCGDAFRPSLTIVTTYWRGREVELEALNTLLAQRLEEWRQLLGYEPQYYEFGKRSVVITGRKRPLIGMMLHGGMSLFLKHRRSRDVTAMRTQFLCSKSCKSLTRTMTSNTPELLKSSVQTIKAANASLEIARHRVLLHSKEQMRLKERQQLDLNRRSVNSLSPNLGGRWA